MKFFSNRASRSIKREHGFTMIEIALCLAIVGFSMVVIMGVLPLGGQVQKKNRESTLSLLDGNYLLEAIRNGAKGYDDLGLYVDEILLYAKPDADPVVIENNVSGGAYWGTREIVGLLSAPQFLMTSSNVWVPNYLNNNEILGNNYYTNMTCKLKVRSMNGTAADKNTLEANRDFGMSYLVEAQILPVATNYMDMRNIKDNKSLNDQMQRERAMSQCAWQVNLTLGWPVQKAARGGYKAGEHSQEFHTVVSGSLDNTLENMEIPGIGTRKVMLWYFDKNNFSVTNNGIFYDQLVR